MRSKTRSDILSELSEEQIVGLVGLNEVEFVTSMLNVFGATLGYGPLSLKAHPRKSIRRELVVEVSRPPIKARNFVVKGL